MKRLFLACMLPLLSLPALAELAVYPGSVAAAARCLATGKAYRSVLLEYMEEWETAAFNRRETCYGCSSRAYKGISRESMRAMVISRIREHPEEVNDVSYQDGYLFMQPLGCALRMNDVELVQLLLAHGAIPYQPLHVYGNTSGDFDEGSDALRNLVEAARASWPQVQPPQFEHLRHSAEAQSRMK